MSSFSSASSLSEPTVVWASLSYLAGADGPARVRTYPPSSGREAVRPAAVERQVPILDARTTEPLELDRHGVELHVCGSAFQDFYDPDRIGDHYLPEVERLVRELTGALEVIAFDHNVRSRVRAERGDPRVQRPVAQVHNDYTARSGPRRAREVLAEAGRLELLRRRVALVNFWRPIVGPVLDNALTVCDAQSVDPGDLVPTEIQHFAEGNLDVPRQVGEIYSVLHSPRHRWLYVSAMQPDELLLLKGYDSRGDGRARFVPHTGFDVPGAPSDAPPRESIEVRTLVVFDEPADDQ